MYRLCYDKRLKETNDVGKLTWDCDIFHIYPINILVVIQSCIDVMRFDCFFNIM